MQIRFGYQARAAAAALGVAASSTFAVTLESPPRPDQREAAPAARAASVESVAGGVKAVVVKSWSNCDSSGVVWRTLNDDWTKFGKVPIHIDYSNPALCTGTITDEALEASGAQVVILSDPAGGVNSFSQGEADALMRYAQAGHNMIGTFLVFRWRDTDNRVLAPLFGLDPERTYNRYEGVSPVFQARAHSPLFEGVGQEYTTSGYLSSQVLWHKKWTKAAAGANQIEAHDDGRRAAILRHCGAGYRADLFTFMPEFGGGTQDQQVLYNAIVQGREPGCKAK
jgi:hypothetical protein